MADRIDATQRVIDRLPVADVGLHELDTGVIGKGPGAVGVDERQQRVDHRDFMTRAGERPHEVEPDEAGTAGYQYSHGPRLRTVMPRGALARHTLISL